MVPEHKISYSILCYGCFINVINLCTPCSLAPDDDTKNQTRTKSPQWARASKLQQWQTWDMSMRVGIFLHCIGIIRKKIEPSLTELHKETMYIPNSALKSLKEIGQGMLCVVLYH